MGNATGQSLSPHDVVHLLRKYPYRWIVPLVTVALIAVVYALLRPATWEASQAVYVREQASADNHRPGSFSDVLDMKAVQETIFELVKSRGVLAPALSRVGPPQDYAKPGAWPTAEDLADVRDVLTMTPPGGAEFGKTEVFYLKVRDHDRQRAVALLDAICQQMEVRFSDLLEEKFDSMVVELKRTVDVAGEELDEATAELADFERGVGVDLAELRMLHASHSAGTDLRQKLVEVHNEIRQYESEKRQQQELLALLRAAQNGHGHLLASPNSLLSSQPALRQIKEGLIEAQLETARLRGRFTRAHPSVRSALASEAEVARHLHNELAIAIRGLEAEQRLNGHRLAELKSQLAQDEARLQRLAGLRAQYGNLVAKAENRTAILEAAQGDLAEARANGASAANVSLLTRIDQPATGTDPIGPSKKIIVLAGMFGGLLSGVGFLLLSVNPQAGRDPNRGGIPPFAGVPATNGRAEYLRDSWSMADLTAYEDPRQHQDSTTTGELTPS